MTTINWKDRNPQGKIDHAGTASTICSDYAEYGHVTDQESDVLMLKSLDILKFQKK